MAKIYGSSASEFATMITAYVVCVKENLRGTKNFNMLSSLLSGRQYEKMIAANLETWNSKSAMASFVRAVEAAHGIKGE